MKKIIKIMMLIISLTLIAGIAQFDLSQAANKGVKISKKHFPDPYFRKAVKKYYDYNKDGYLSKSETAFVFKMNHEPGHYLFGKSKKIWKKKYVPCRSLSCTRRSINFLFESYKLWIYGV